MHDELNIDSQEQPHLGTMFSPVLDKQWPFNKYLLNKGNFWGDGAEEGKNW